MEIFAERPQRDGPRSKWSVTHAVYDPENASVPEPSVSEAASAVAETVQQALGGLDLEAVRRSYWEQNEFVCLERWLPLPLIDRMLAEVERVRPAINRNYIPRHKKGGSVSFYTLRAEAPTIVALYKAPAFIEFL